MLDITARLLCYQTVMVGEAPKSDQDEVPALYVFYDRDGTIVDVFAENGKYKPIATRNLPELELLEITRVEYDVLLHSRHSGEYRALGWDEPAPPPNKDQITLPYK